MTVPVFYETLLDKLTEKGYSCVGVPVLLHGHQHNAHEYEDALHAEKDNKGQKIDAIVVYAQPCELPHEMYFTPVEPSQSTPVRPIKKFDVMVAIALTCIKKPETGKFK